MQEKMYGDCYRSTIVCVDAYDHRIMQGYLYNPAAEGMHSFQGTMQFLLELECLLNDMQFPQQFMRVRTYSPVERRMPGAMTDDGRRTGKRATFMLRVLFRQNASWQGVLTWLEGDKREQYRSVLELLELIDSALDPDNTEI